MANELQFILYVLGGVFSFLLALRNLRIPYRLAKLYGLAMLGWWFNCTVLNVLVGYDIMFGETPPSTIGAVIKTINALLLSTAPMLLYYIHPRKEDLDAP